MGNSCHMSKSHLFDLLTSMSLNICQVYLEKETVERQLNVAMANIAVSRFQKGRLFILYT